MENFYIAPTPSSPEVDFRFDQHRLSLRGESYPENAAAFYGELLRQLRLYLGACSAQPVIVDIALAYFNSSSTKMLFNMFEALNAAAAAGNEITVHWHHDEEDETMLEFGEELGDDFPGLNFFTQPVRAN